MSRGSVGGLLVLVVLLFVVTAQGGPGGSAAKDEFEKQVSDAAQQIEKKVGLGLDERIDARLTKKGVTGSAPKVDIKELASLQLQVSGFEKELKTLRALPASLNKKADLSSVPTKEDVEKLRKQFDSIDHKKLLADVAGLLLKVTKIEKDLTAATSSKTELKKQLDAMTTQLTKQEKEHAAAIKAIQEKMKGGEKALQAKMTEAEKLKSDLTAQKKATMDAEIDKARLEGSLATAKDAAKKLEAELAKKKVPPTDVLILWMHSNNLSLESYAQDLPHLLERASKSFSPAESRLGFGYVLGQTKEIEPLQTLENGYSEDVKTAFRKLPPVEGTDSLEGSAEMVKKMFKDKQREKRCVIIASVDCRPVRQKELPDWTGISVSVVLIGDRDTTRPTAAQIQDWQEFCAPGGWPLQVMYTQARAKSEPPPAFKEQLNGWLWKFIQPERSQRKSR